VVIFVLYLIKGECEDMTEMDYKQKAKELLRQQFQTKMDEIQAEYDELVIEYERQKLLDSIKGPVELQDCPVDLTEFGYNGIITDITDYEETKNILKEKIALLECTVNKFLN
jgi:hypothetical protein